MSFGRPPVMFVLEPYKLIIWSWYILDNRTLLETHNLLHNNYHQITTSNCNKPLSLRTLESQLCQWGFKKYNQPHNNGQLCQRIYVLFYDLGLNDHEILLFLQCEKYNITIYQ